MLITEAEIDGNYPATHVDNSGKDNAYKNPFPGKKEEAVYPNDKSKRPLPTPWKSPWRNIIVGKDLNTIFTLANGDTSQPSIGCERPVLDKGRTVFMELVVGEEITQCHNRG